MNRQQAEELARRTSGTVHHSGGGIHLVLMDSPGPYDHDSDSYGPREFVVLSEDMACAYPDRAAWERGDEPMRTEGPR